MQCLICALLMLGLAHAATTKAPPLVFAFSELAPWKTKTGETYDGAYTDIVRELARRVGRELQITECPHPRCMLMMGNGTADLSIGIQATPEREQSIAFLQTPYRLSASDRVFYVRRGEAQRIRSYADLRGLHIGVCHGCGYFDRFDADTTLEKESAPGNANNLLKLTLHRLDAVIMPEDQGAVLLAQMGLGKQLETAVYREHDLVPRFVAVSRHSAAFALLPQLEAAMLAMRRDGTLKAIYDRDYFQRYGVTRKQVPLE